MNWNADHLNEQKLIEITLHNSLEKWGYNIKTSTDITTATGKVQNWQPALISWVVARLLLILSKMLDLPLRFLR